MRTVGFVNASSGFTDEERALRASMYSNYLPEDVRVIVEGIPSSPQFFDERHHFDEALAAAEAYFRSLPPGRFDAIVWAGAIDPGLAMVRSLSPIPVVGPGEAGLFLASVIGRPTSIVTVDEHAVAVTQELLEHVAAKPPIASVRSIAVPVRQIVGDRQKGAAALRRECVLAIEEDGAGTIYLGSMTLGTLGVAEEIRATYRLPVINPMQIAAATVVQILDALGPVKEKEDG